MASCHSTCCSTKSGKLHLGLGMLHGEIGISYLSQDSITSNHDPTAVCVLVPEPFSSIIALKLTLFPRNVVPSHTPPPKKKDGKISKPNFFQNMLSVCRSKQLKESEIYKCPALTALSNSIFWISSQSLEAGFGWTRELRAHMLRETQKYVHMYCRYFVDVGGFKTHLKKNFRQ